MNSLYASLALIWHSDLVLLGLSIFIFDIPRYTLSIIATAALPALKSRSNRATQGHRPQISAIIATHNGGDTLLRSIDALRRQTLPPTEIIVIDDGSTDDTRAISEQALQAGLISAVFRHGTRCGKSAAINHGARFAKGELLVNIDDDTVLGPTSLANLSAAVMDRQLAIASGNLAIGNKDASLWTSLQAIEYLVSITTGRRFLALIDSISCCSGAFSMFRRNIYIAIGGMNVGPGEDLEITLRARKVGYRVGFVPEASAYVDGLTSFRGLARQRQRWDRDALRIRFFMFREWTFRKPFENLGDTLQRLDFIIFDLFPSLMFPFYVLYIMAIFGSNTLAYLLGIYLILLPLALLNIGIVLIKTRHRLTMFDAASTLLFPVYQGILMKLVRFVAFSTELIYPMKRDSYVPPRVLRALFEQR